MNAETTPLNGAPLPAATDGIEALRAERIRTKPTNLADWPRWNRPLEIRVAAAMLADPKTRGIGGEFENTDATQFFVPPIRTLVNILRNLDAAGVVASPEEIADKWKQDNLGNFYDQGQKLLDELATATPEQRPRVRAALAAELQASQLDALNMMERRARITSDAQGETTGDNARSRIEVRLLADLAGDIIKQASLPELDWGVEGLNRSAPLPLRSLATLVGPTGAGKSSLAMQIAAHRARYGSAPGERQGPTVYLLFELTLTQFAARHASQLSHYTQRQILSGAMPQHEIEAALTGEHLYVIKPPRRVPDIIDYANLVLDEVVKRSPGIPLIVFDYLQRIKGAGRDIRESTSNVVDAIVDLVESRDMYCLLVSKGSRAGSKSMRDGKTRGEALVDVAAETSAIEYGSAAILAITYENREGEGTLDARIEITKGRFGSTGASIGMRFHGASGRWEELVEVPPTTTQRFAEDRILAAVDREPAGFESRNALSAAAGGNRTENLAAIRRLLVPGGMLEEPGGRIVRRRS